MSNSDEPVRVPLGVTDLPSHPLFVQDPPDALYHYTSLQGAYGIITSRQLWLTKIQYLNDVTELRYAIDLFQNTVARWRHPLDAEKKAFIDAVAHQLGSFRNTNICVASFCTNGDLLSQWRAYGTNAKGVALGFSGTFFKEIANKGIFRTWKCIYEPYEHQQIISELIEMAFNCFAMRHDLATEEAQKKFVSEITGWFNTIFLQVAPTLKHKSFYEEQEWRVISSSVKITHKEFDIVLIGSRLRPVFKLPFAVGKDGQYTVLREIYLGPTADPELAAYALFSLLHKHGYSSVTIHHSQIPYRAPQ